MEFCTGLLGTFLLFGSGELSQDVRGLNQTGVGGRVRLRLTIFCRIGPQLMLQNLLIGGETLPLLMRFILAFLTLTYAA